MYAMLQRYDNLFERNAKEEAFISGQRFLELNKA